MPFIKVNYSSNSLQKESELYIAMPSCEGPYPVLYLLHGLSDDASGWSRRTSIERHAEAAGVMVVMPDGGRSFYCDLPQGLGNYDQHMLEVIRFVDATFRTIPDRTGRAIGGLSMGGYGAMKFALKYPELFVSATSHSGATDIKAILDEKFFPEVNFLFAAGLDPAADLFALAARPGLKPALRIDCGTEDFLLQENRDFHARLLSLGVEHEYEEFPGDHNWGYWDEHVIEALAFHKRHFEMKLSV